MNGVSRIGHMALRVSDLDAAVGFHADVLGLVETERQGGVSYLTCNERHHELILIESAERGYDHIGLEVPDPETLERLRSGVAAAGGELIGRDLRRRAGHRPSGASCAAQAATSTSSIAAWRRSRAPPAGDRPVKFEHVSVKARRLGPTERFFADGLGFRFSDRMGRTASWWHCDADHHGLAVVFGPRPELSHYAWTLPDLNAIGRVADRLLARGPQADLGTEPPRSRQQPLPLLPRCRRGDDRVLRRHGDDAARWRLPGPALAGRARRDQPVGRAAAATLPAHRLSDRAGRAAVAELTATSQSRMKLRRIAEGLIVRHDSGHWVPVRGEGLTDEESQDMVAFLAGGEETRAVAEAMLAGIEDPAAEAVDPARRSIPFQPRSMRAFMLWESHYDRVEPDAREALLPAARRQGGRRIRAPHRQDVPEAEAEQALLREADLLRRQPRGAARRRRPDVVARATPSGSTSSWSWPLSSPGRSQTQAPRRPLPRSAAGSS